MDYQAKHTWYNLQHDVGRRLAGATLDGYEVESQAQAQLVSRIKTYVADIKSMREQGVNVLLFGSCGTGKDHLSMCIARAAHMAGYTVAWKNGEDLYGDIRDVIDSRYTEADLIAEYVRPDFLWLSDPLPPSGSLTDWQRRWMFRIVDARYRKAKPMVVTANVNDHQEFCDRVGNQVTDRLLGSAISWMCRWPSYRSKGFGYAAQGNG